MRQNFPEGLFMFEKAGLQAAPPYQIKNLPLLDEHDELSPATQPC